MINLFIVLVLVGGLDSLAKTKSKFAETTNTFVSMAPNASRMWELVIVDIPVTAHKLMIKSGTVERPVFAGNSCQYIDMDVCTIGDEYLGRPLYFCVNGGSCNAKVTADMPDPICTCPNGYTGLSCEINVGIDAKRLVLITGVLLALVGVLALVANYI